MCAKKLGSDIASMRESNLVVPTVTNIDRVGRLRRMLTLCGGSGGGAGRASEVVLDYVVVLVG